VGGVRCCGESGTCSTNKKDEVGGGSLAWRRRARKGRFSVRGKGFKGDLLMICRFGGEGLGKQLDPKGEISVRRGGAEEENGSCSKNVDRAKGRVVSAIRLEERMPRGVRGRDTSKSLRDLGMKIQRSATYSRGVSFRERRGGGWGGRPAVGSFTKEKEEYSRGRTGWGSHGKGRRCKYAARGKRTQQQQRKRRGVKCLILNFTRKKRNWPINLTRRQCAPKERGLRLSRGVVCTRRCGNL